MTTSKAASRPSGRGAAARSEVNGKVRTITLKTAPVKGLKVTAGPELPSTFTWDGARIGSLVEANDPRAVGALYRLIESVIGEDDAGRLRDKLAETKTDPGVDLLVGLVNDIAGEYGTDLGE